LGLYSAPGRDYSDSGAMARPYLARKLQYPHKFLDTCLRPCNMLHMVLLPAKDKRTVRITNI